MQESAGSTRGSVTRRAFVKGALAAGVTAGFAGLAGPVAAVAQEEAATATGTALVKDPQYSFEFIPEAIDESLIVETVDCDILVVGADVSGMAGIVYGAAQSANVHVLEKGPTHGVHRLCVAGLNSKLAVAATGSTIDPKDFTQDFYRATGGFQTKVPVVSRYAKDSGKWIDWLVEAMAPYGWSLLPPTNTRKQGSNWVEYDTPHFFMNPDGENIMTGKTPNWMELFHKIAEDLGATFHFNEPAVRLEREGELSGRITSVISKNLITGEYRRYSASKGVLCAAGDMFNDKELVPSTAPSSKRRCRRSLSPTTRVTCIRRRCGWARPWMTTRPVTYSGSRAWSARTTPAPGRGRQTTIPCSTPFGAPCGHRRLQAIQCCGWMTADGASSTRT